MIRSVWPESSNGPRHAPLASLQGTATVTRQWVGRADPFTDIERHRAALLVSASDTADFIAAHLLIRDVVSFELGCEPEEVEVASRCPSCGMGDHGRPFVEGQPELGITLSHTCGVVAAALAWGAVGIDVEVREHRLPDDIVVEALTPRELDAVLAAPEPLSAFLRVWVCKEALVKAGAVGLNDIARVDISHVIGSHASAGQTQWAGLTVAVAAGLRNVVAAAVSRHPVDWTVDPSLW